MKRTIILKLLIRLKKYKIQTYFCICCLLLSPSLKAQQEPMYSQYMFNMLQINPAYAGNRAMNNITTIFRKQWVGIKGAPTTASLSWDARAQESNIGYGLQISNDQIGIESTTGFQAFYSYHIPFERSSLSIGLSAGVINYYAGLRDVNTVVVDPLFSSNINKLLPSVGIGALYATENWYAGFSIPALLNTKISSQNYQITTGANNHYFLTGGYVFDVSEAVRLKPSILIKAVKGSPFQYDINLNVWLQKYVGVGLSYRTGDALVGLLELQITPNIGFGYAYDYTLSQLKTFNNGTHELMLRYEFGNGNKHILSPRLY
jgi:type IX secretion system PorP/SprF family membrane protein